MNGNNGNNNGNIGNDNFDTLDKICWGLFSKTGNIGYYFLYNDVKKRRNKKKDD